MLSEKQGDRAKAKAALQDVVALLIQCRSIHPLPAPADAAQRTGALRPGRDRQGQALPESFYRAQPATPVAKLLGQIYMQERRPRRPSRSRRAYLRGYPGDGQALTQLAVAHLAKLAAGQAAQLMQDALKAKDAPEYRTALGLSLIQSGDVGAATKELQAAFKKDPARCRPA